MADKVKSKKAIVPENLGNRLREFWDEFTHPRFRHVAYALDALCLILLLGIVWLYLNSDNIAQQREARIPYAESVVTMARPIDSDELPADAKPHEEEQLPEHEVEPRALEMPTAPERVESVQDMAEDTAPATAPEPEPTPQIAEQSVVEVKEAVIAPDLPIRLSPKPAPDLLEKIEFGDVPKISAKGEKPWQFYARPLPPSIESDLNTPRIAILVTDLGVSDSLSKQAMDSLPPEISLAFNPYSDNLDTLMRQARETGHETFMMLPMEPMTYPDDDPGPRALLTSVSQVQNRNRLQWVMARGHSYVGLINFMGSRFMTADDHMPNIMDEINKRGLAFLDTRETPRSLAPRLAREINMPFTTIDFAIDRDLDEQKIMVQLEKLEIIAREYGLAIGTASPYPITFENLKKWVDTLEKKNIRLVPVSSLIVDETP